MIWIAVESQTDWAAAESSGQERSIPVMEEWRLRKSEMVGLVQSVGGGRAEGSAGWAAERSMERLRVEARATDAEGRSWEQRVAQVGSGSRRRRGMVARDG
jgi:hypothetical protein